MSSIHTYSVLEYGLILPNELRFPGEVSDLDKLFVPKEVFSPLLSYVKNEMSNRKLDGKVFRIEYRRGKEIIRAQSYVGVLQFSSGFQIEILPKIVLSRVGSDMRDIRKAFAQLLSHTKDFRFLRTGAAHLQTANNYPLLEVFISAFLDELQRVLNTGLQSDYENREGNLNAVRGKVLVTENIKRNSFRPYKVYCQYSDYVLDIPANRVLKSALLRLNRLSFYHGNLVQIRRFLGILSQVHVSESIASDIHKSRALNRNFSHYELILQWAQVFLSEQSFANNAGSQISISILFPMYKVFESYVAYLFKRYSLGYEVREQEQDLFLASQNNEDKFNLRPDLVVYQNDMPVLILDTKWKRISAHLGTSNYGISEKDMYQLYVYGKKYSEEYNNTPKLFLLYPESEDFNVALPTFNYDNSLKLSVQPFSFRTDSQQQIQYLLNLTI